MCTASLHCLQPDDDGNRASVPLLPADPSLLREFLTVNVQMWLPQVLLVGEHSLPSLG